MIQNRTLKAALQSQVLANKKIQKSFDQEVEPRFGAAQHYGECAGARFRPQQDERGPLGLRQL